jgi:Flp pilus assembly protein TadG
MATVRSASEQGQAIIELALTLPLLLLVVLGVFDFGLMFQRYEVVTNAAREGARLGVLTDQYTTGQARQRAIDYLNAGGVTGNLRTGDCTTTGAAGDVCVFVSAPSDVTITGTSPAVTVKEVLVRVEYDHSFTFVGPIMNLFGGSLGTTPLRVVSRMRVE